MLRNKSSSSSENGNVFLFIMLGVVLFGALAFIISRGMRSDTTTAMSARKAELVAVDVLAFVQRLERSVAKMQRSGVSENDISFENSFIAGYDHTPPQPDNHNVFHPTGGAMNWQNPPTHANDGSPWIFSGRNCIADVGTGATGCGANSINDEELMVILPNMNASVCRAIDQKLGISGIVANAGDNHSAIKFTGSFSDGAEITLDGPRSAACFQMGSYTFYYVLIAR